MTELEQTESPLPEQDSGNGAESDQEHRIIVTLSGDAYRKLKGTADRRELTVAELVKSGLALAEWLEDESSRGNQVLVKRGGRLREVTLPGDENAD